MNLADPVEALHLENLIPAPYSWIIRLAAPFVGAGVVAAVFMGFVAHERHVGAASQAPKVEAARDQGATARLNLKGAQDSAARVDAYQHLTLTLNDATAAAVAAAGAAPDAHAPLDPARADRLRAFDRQLCSLRSTVCPGPAPQGGDAGAGAGAVQAPRAADPGDAG